MQQLPKLVRQRLQANSAGQHPDSELLTAYVEQSLTARERLQMDDHLAGCSECRQVVALATPETVSPASTTGLQRAPARNWLRWNGLRWGTAAACLVVVGAAVMLNVREKANAPLRSEPQTARHVETAPSAPAPAPQYEAKAIPPASTMVLVVPTPDTRKATTGAEVEYSALHRRGCPRTSSPQILRSCSSVPGKLTWRHRTRKQQCRS